MLLVLQGFGHLNVILKKSFEAHQSYFKLYYFQIITEGAYICVYQT